MKTYLYTSILNGQKIAHSNHTEFLVQVGKGKKGSYKTVSRVVGDLDSAAFIYASLRPGAGKKKRLVMPESLVKKGVLVREL